MGPDPGSNDLVHPKEWERLGAYIRGEDMSWDVVLEAVEQGQIISIPYLDDRQRRSMTRAITRGARSRGFRVEYRDGPNQTRAFRRIKHEGEDDR